MDQALDTPVYRLANWGWDRLRNLAAISQLLRGGVETWTDQPKSPGAYSPSALCLLIGLPAALASLPEASWSPCSPSHAATAPTPGQNVGRGSGPPEASPDSHTEHPPPGRNFQPSPPFWQQQVWEFPPPPGPVQRNRALPSSWQTQNQTPVARYYSCMCEMRSVYSACHMPGPVVVLGRLEGDPLKRSFRGRISKHRHPPLPFSHPHNFTCSSSLH